MAYVLCQEMAPTVFKIKKSADITQCKVATSAPLTRFRTVPLQLGKVKNEDTLRRTISPYSGAED